MGSDPSLSSLSLTASSDSSESRDAEATSVAMGASTSHATRSPSHASIVEAGVPSAGPRPPVVENPIPPYYLGYEPCGSTCAQGTEGSSILHSPSNAQVLQSEQVFVEPDVRDGEYHGLLDRLLGLNFVYDNSAQGEGSQAPYFPSYYPALVNFDDNENIGGYLSVLSHNRSELYSRVDGSLSQQDLLHCPESRIGGLIDSHGLCGTERTNLARHSSPRAEQLTREIMSSRQSLETNGMQNASDEVVAEDSTEKEAGEKNRCATNFDCNICFNIAKEPVVTSCGHLFCWPCLYQWLRVHSDYKECAVCKGEVTEDNVTPIYGRGCFRSDDENKDEGNSDSGLPIPLRPRGKRLESVRERFYTNSRMVGEGIANSQSRFLDYQIHNRSRFSGNEDVFLWGLSENPAIFSRSMIIELQREQRITEDEPITVERRFPRDGESVSSDDGTTELYTGLGLHCFPANDRLDCMNSEIGRAAGRFTENINFFGPSSFDNSPNPGQSVSIPILGERPATDQPSTSSTLAVIYSESSARDGSAELNSVGSSRPSRRISGSNSSGSSDDGGNLRARKRRRLH